MKIERIKLEGYIGIYNGMKRHSIEVSFKNTLNRITVIVGLNGSGKSTLQNALHVFPDNNDSFMPSTPARKEIDLRDGDILYKIVCIHGVKPNGDRETTKVYLTKIDIDGSSIKLNENGNVGTYKEIIESELNLDPNYLMLTKLSSSDRGIADKKPAERKKFLNSIIERTESFTAMNKVLSKRAYWFKSMVNNITFKIDSIGDEVSLKSTLNSLENRLNKMMVDKNELLEALASQKSIISMSDPDGSIQMSYNTIYSNMEAINLKLSGIRVDLSSNLNKVGLEANTTSEYMSKLFIDIQKDISNIETEIAMKEQKIHSLLSLRETESKELISKTTKLQSLMSDGNIYDLDKQISHLKSSIAHIEEVFDSMGFKDEITLTKDEYLIGMATLKDIKETIDVFRSTMSYSIISEAISIIINDDSIDIGSIEEALASETLRLSMLETDLVKHRFLLEKTESLNLRPSKCKIDDCPFIFEALKASNETSLEIITNLESEIAITKSNISTGESLLKESKEVLECINYLNRILRLIYTNKSILSKLPNSDKFIDKNVILDRIYINDGFNDITYLQSYVEKCDMFNQYSILKNNLIKMEAQRSVYDSKIDLINEIKSDLTSIESKISGITSEIDSCRVDINSMRMEYISKSSTLDVYRSILSIFDQIQFLNSEKDLLLSQFNTINISMQRISEAIERIDVINSRIKAIDDEISPILNDRDEIKHGLKLLYQYMEELDEYRAKYDKAEVLKKYSSPTTAGIQLLFMNLYMGKTLDLANRLLSTMFDNNYTLLMPKINEDGFKIPCQGLGLINDDISSMSTSEICMISMVLGVAMLQQASTKYNVLLFDEIDSGLDYENRVKFLHLTNSIMNVLNVEQAIFVTHNTEMDYRNCDLVVLRITDEYESIISNSNVIFRHQ